MLNLARSCGKAFIIHSCISDLTSLFTRKPASMVELMGAFKLKYSLLYWPWSLWWLKSAKRLLIDNGRRISTHINKILKHSKTSCSQNLSFVYCVAESNTTGESSDGKFKQSFRRCYEIESILMVAARVMWTVIMVSELFVLFVVFICYFYCIYSYLWVVL